MVSETEDNKAVMEKKPLSVGLIVDPEKFGLDALKVAAERAKDGRLDLVLVTFPELFSAKEQVIRKLYDYAGLPAFEKDLENTDVNVVLSMADRHWDLVVVPDNVAILLDAPREEVHNSLTEDLTLTYTTSEITQYHIGCVGGTFDHLHHGHRLLLTLAALVTRHRLIVGITGPALLVNKKYKEIMEPFDARVLAVRDFLAYIKPELYVDIYELKDIYGPTTQVENLDCLIVTEETLSNADKVNEERAKRGWSRLAIVEVGLVPDYHENGKLSSTLVRKRIAETKDDNTTEAFLASKFNSKFD